MIKIEKPLVVRIETTMRCNHSCLYCYNPMDRNTPLYREKAKKNLREIISIIDSWGSFDVTFTGGEPFIEKEILFMGIAAVKETNMDFGINTNTSLITREDARYLKEQGVASIFASFPSLKKDTFEAITNVIGSYDRVLRGYEYLADEGIKMAANMVVIKHPVSNIDDVYETGAILVRKFGIRRFCVTPVSPSHKTHAQFMPSNSDIVKILEQAVQVNQEFDVDIRNSRPLPICFLEGLDPNLARYDFFRGCTMGAVNGITIDLEGNLKPCPVMPFSIANVFKEDFDEIVKKLSVFDGRDQKKLKENAPGECYRCSVLDVCKGGCKTEALALADDIKTKSRFMKTVQTDEVLMNMIMGDVNLKSDQLYKIRENIKYRKDSDDIYIIRAESFVVLNQREFDFFQYLASLDKFSPNSLIEHYVLDKGILNIFFNKLNKAKAIVKVQLGGEKNGTETGNSRQAK